MHSSRLRRLAFAVWLLVAARGFTQVDEVPRIRFKQVCQLKPNGDVVLTNELTFSVQMYTNLKKQITNTAVLLRQLGMTGQAAELKDAKAHYDDARHTVRVTGRVLGGLKNRGKEWLAEIAQPEQHELVDTDPDAITLLAVNQLDNGTLVIGSTRLEFPRGTEKIRFEPRRGGVLFEMPPPPSQAGGNVDVDMDIRVRRELMTCLYKVYGNPRFSQLWVAKAVFRNNGTARLRDFRVRFRIADYSSWSPWKRARLVYPTQTVVEPFHPIVSHAVRKLKSATPATLEVAWSYRTPDGQLVEESESRRLSILGLNEVVYSNLPGEEATSWFEIFNMTPLVCSTFVSHTDPIIQRYAGMAARLAGGAGASISNQNAMRFMRAVYDLMCYHQIKYQSPPWMWRRGFRQHVKFGRDVLRNRAGTCIDLAILYASTCQAGGLEPILVVIPGHCFPVIKLPKGGIQAVEATCASGTNDGRRIPFDHAAREGMKELAAAIKKGLIYMVDIQKVRAMGVPTPELPDLPPRTLDDWGIKAPAGITPTSGTGQPPRGGEGKSTGGMKEVADPNGRFTLSVPTNWQVQQQQGGIAAGDPQSGAMAMCMAAPKQVQSLEQFAKVMIGMWKQQVPGWKEAARRNLQVSGLPCLAIRATGKPQNQEMAADYFLVLSKQHQHLMILSCPQRTFQQAQAAFKRIFASWRVR